MDKSYKRPSYMKTKSSRQEITPAMKRIAQAFKENGTNFTKQLLENQRRNRQIQEQIVPEYARSKHRSDKELAQPSAPSDATKEEMYRINRERLEELKTIQPVSYAHAMKISEERQQRIALDKERIAMEKQRIEEKREHRNRERKARFKFTSKGQPVMKAYIASLLKQVERQTSKS